MNDLLIRVTESYLTVTVTHSTSIVNVFGINKKKVTYFTGTCCTGNKASLSLYFDNNDAPLNFTGLSTDDYVRLMVELKKP